MSDLERRIDRLEQTLQRMAQHFGPSVITYRQDAQGEPTEALSGGELLAERLPGETVEAFWARAEEAAGPLPAGTMRLHLPDNGRGPETSDK